MSDVLDYDAGLLNDYGGGNVEWWQDYLRAEICRANHHWRAQTEALLAERDATLARAAKAERVRAEVEAYYGQAKREVAEAEAEVARLREALHGLITTLWVDGPNAENIINADALTNARLALAKEAPHD